MNKILVFGHKSPDTDSICSALVMADLEKYLSKNTAVVACRLGDLNKETEYALNYFKINAPELIAKIDDNAEVILVDHNEAVQSVDNIENAKILKVVDHHRIGIKTAEPLFYMAEPVGCTSTILYSIYKMNNIEITPAMAGLMLSAIISDTLLLKSPTTTKKDIKAVEELAKIANVDYNTYGLEMLKAGTDLSNYSTEELLNIDAKLIDMNGNRVKI